jgi:hypothetical protein
VGSFEADQGEGNSNPSDLSDAKEFKESYSAAAEGI